MLARRFTVVCLMCALFGMAFADLASRRAGSRLGDGLVVACRTDQGIACTPLALRSGFPSRRF